MGLTEERIDILVKFTKSSDFCKLTYLGPKGTFNYSFFIPEPMIGQALVSDVTSEDVVLRLQNIHPRRLSSYYRTSIIKSITSIPDGIMFETLNSTYLLERTVV